MTDIAVSLLPNLDMSLTEYNASLSYLEQTLVRRVDVQLICKNVRRNKKVYIKCKFVKYPRQIQHSVKDLKMELLVKTVSEFKLNYFC